MTPSDVVFYLRAQFELKKHHSAFDLFWPSLFETVFRVAYSKITMSIQLPVSELLNLESPKNANCEVSKVKHFT